MRKLMLCIAVSCLLMTSCLSDNVVAVEKTVVPELVFPVFPKLKRTVNDDGSWLIPRESADALSEYYILIMNTENDYNELKRLYEEKNDEQ